MGVNIAGLSVFAGAPPMNDLDLFATTGRVFYVGSVAAPGGVVGVDAAGAYGDSPQRPFAALDYAIDGEEVVRNIGKVATFHKFPASDVTSPINRLLVFIYPVERKTILIRLKFGR